MYDNSVIKMICSVYSDKNWLVWKFVESDSEHWDWNSLLNQRKFFDYLREQQRLSNNNTTKGTSKVDNNDTFNDLYNIERTYIGETGGSQLLKMYNYNVPEMITTN